MNLMPMTELEAVNLMLDAIGESPINSLDGLQAVDAIKARSMLTTVSRMVQETGWHFNTEPGIRLLPSVPSKEIRLPANCLKVDTIDASADVDVVERGGRLYDRRNQTYEFERGLTVKMVVYLPFDDLPSAARHYITLRAARQFQQGTVGSETLYRFTARDEALALAALRRASRQTGNPNMLRDSASVSRVMDRLL